MTLERPDGLDPLLMDLTRLSLVGLLAAADWAEFPLVRDALDLTDSALSKQVATLEKAGVVSARKGYVGKRPRTWLQLTDPGRDRLQGHLRALQRFVDDAAAAAPTSAPAPPVRQAVQPDPADVVTATSRHP